MHRRHFLSRASAAGAVFVAAAPAIVSAQSAAKQIRLLLSTDPPDPACHYLYYARELGYFEQEGVSVEFKETPGEAFCIRALVAGVGDVAWAGGVSCVAAANGGSKIKAISSVAPRVDYMIVAQKGIADLKGLEGKTIGITSPGSISWEIPLRMMEQQGADPKTVRWAPLGNSVSRLQGLIAKRLDAAALNSSFARDALKYDYLHIIANSFKELPLELQNWDTAAEAAIGGKPDAVQGYVTAVIRGARWGIDHPAEAGEISAKLLPEMPRQEVVDGIADFAARRFWNLNGDLSRAAWDFTTSWMVEHKQVEGRPSYDSFYVPKFVDAALAKLGRVPA